MLVTSRDDIKERVLFLRDHGRPPGDRYFMNTEVAYKYKMSCLQAAVGLAQVERAEELVARKRQIFGWYEARLGEVDGITLNAEPEGTRNSYWMVTAVLGERFGLGPREVMDLLGSESVDTRPFFQPLRL